MSETTMAQIDFASAKAEDYEEVLSISGGIYKGVDYLPARYHTWLKDHRRRMLLAKIQGKIVAFESFILVDDGETAVVEGLRVAPWMRGQGVAGLIQKYCLDLLHSDHPEVKRVRLTHVEDPSPKLQKKYKFIHSKAGLSIYLPKDQLEEAIKLLEARLDNLGQADNSQVLENSEVLKLFDKTKVGDELLPGGLLVQGWLPLTTKKSNLELLFERKIIWIYSDGHDTTSSNEETSGKDNATQPNTSSDTQYPTYEFLSLCTPPYPVPYGEATYRFDIDMFGVDPTKAKCHILQQLKIGLTTLCIFKEQMILEMDI
ncbi:putative N-acetyltransferase 16 [Gastrophryne carolinensis]